MVSNIPEVKLGIIAVSRDCFPIGLSTQRRKNIVAAYNGPLYECPVTVENELDMQKAVADVKANDCNALVALTKSIHSKRERLIAAKKKLSAVDERYMKRAEDLLFGELGAALGIEKSAVREYINEKIAVK